MKTVFCKEESFHSKNDSCQLKIDIVVFFTSFMHCLYYLYYCPCFAFSLVSSYLIWYIFVSFVSLAGFCPFLVRPLLSSSVILHYFSDYYADDGSWRVSEPF